MSALPLLSARARLYEATRAVLYKLMTNLSRIPAWDDQMLYVASQLNTVGLICGSLLVEDGKVNVTSMLKARVLMDCVTNIMAGCKEGATTVDGKPEPSFVEAEFQKLSVPVQNRKTRKGYHRKQFDNNS